MSDGASDNPQADSQSPSQSPSQQRPYDPYDDPMAPPKEPVECFCLHCQRIFVSDQMWFQKVIGDPHGFPGYWMCPTPNCDGAGWGMDIFATDPNHPDGWQYDDGEDYDEDDFDDDDFDDEDFTDDFALAETETGEDDEYDPAESKYRELDDRYGDGEDDLIEGDEWKLGISPGEAVPFEMYLPEAQRREWEEEQKKYDEPDLRPRELDWSDREYSEQQFKEDDIPF